MKWFRDHEGIVGYVVAVLVVTGVLLLQQYQSSLRLVESQRTGCERGKLDRRANASAWRAASEIRRAQKDFDVARKYAGVAAGLEARSRIDCRRAFPDPAVIP